MTTGIYINTERVTDTAQIIKVCNDNISAEIEEVERVIQQLNDAWDGMASEAAISKYQNIKKTYYERRYKVMNQYTDYLLTPVNQGYEQTENVNTSLSDAFK